MFGARAGAALTPRPPGAIELDGVREIRCDIRVRVAKATYANHEGASSSRRIVDAVERGRA
jgi:hypothetical protein